MNDLISRQAAIDGKISVQRTNGVEIYSDDVVPVKYLENLPPAQPEIIRCKDCKHWTTNIGDSELRDNYCNEAMHGFYYRCSGDDFCSYAESESERMNGFI